MPHHPSGNFKSGNGDFYANRSTLSRNSPIRDDQTTMLFQSSNPFAQTMDLTGPSTFQASTVPLALSSRRSHASGGRHVSQTTVVNGPYGLSTTQSRDSGNGRIPRNVPFSPGIEAYRGERDFQEEMIFSGQEVFPPPSALGGYGSILPSSSRVNPSYFDSPAAIDNNLAGNVMPDNARHIHILRLPLYPRTDVSFSLILIHRGRNNPPIALRCDWRDCEYPGNFSREGCLWRHIKSQHISPDEFKCHVCQSTFGRKDRFRNHMLTVHDIRVIFK
jgi:hypothetical protein